jgi:hypothetical protein
MGAMNTIVVEARNSELALAAARIGATVVVVGCDAQVAGEVARAVDDAGGRALVFGGEPGAALDEMLGELLPPGAPASTSRPEGAPT